MEFKWRRDIEEAFTGINNRMILIRSWTGNYTLAFVNIERKSFSLERKSFFYAMDPAKEIPLHLIECWTDVPPPPPKTCDVKAL